MSAVAQAARIVRGIVTHPANRGRRLPALARFVLWQAWQRLRGTPLTVPAFGRMRLRLHPHRPSASAVYYNRLPEWAEMSFVQAVLRRGDVFLDVGANVGVYTLLAASVLGPAARILAVEPDPRARALLRENVALNRLGGVSVHAAAVGAAPGFARMTAGLDAMNHVLEVFPAAEAPAAGAVPLCTLDDICGDAAPFLAKMDVEGHELEALKGAGRLLQERRPAAWVLEANECGARYGVTPADLAAWIRARGGEVCAYEPEERRLLPARLSDGYLIAVFDRAAIAARL